MGGSGRGDRRRRPARGPGRDEGAAGIGAILGRSLGAGRMRRGMALGRLVRAWEDVVGPRLARETRPLALDEGGLVVAASSAAWGSQVRFLAQEVRRGANRALGSEEVRSVRVVVAAMPPDALRRKGREAPEEGGEERWRGSPG